MKSNRTVIFPVYSLALAVLAVATLAAADADSSVTAEKPDSIYELDKMVVTASRTAHRVSETPAAVNVIDKKSIETSPAKTVEDLLVGQPGIQVKRAVAIGEGIPSEIVIRGIPGALAAARTLVLVDGIPTNVSGTPLLIVNSVPMEVVDRIEVVRGPCSSLYGANAFGGVVNIITQEGVGKPTGTVTAETSYPFTAIDRYLAYDGSAVKALDTAARWSYYNLNGTVRGGNDKAGLVVSAGYRSIGNYLMSDSGLARNGDRTRGTSIANRDYEEYRVFSKAKLYCSDRTDLSLHVRYFNSELGLGKTRKLPDSMDIVTKGNMVLVGPQMNMTFGEKGVFHAGAYLRRVIGEFWNEAVDTFNAPAVQSYWKSNATDWQVESRCSMPVGNHNTLTTGIDVLRNNANFGATINPETGKKFQNSSPADKSITNTGCFLQDELKLFERLNIVPSARMDYHSTFGATFSPKLGISYALSDMVRFRSSAGSAFRAPSLAELYLPPLPAIGGYWVRANPNLKPERIWGFDAGMDLTPDKSLTVKVGPFYNKMSNLVGVTAVSGDSLVLIYITHRNISSAWSEGIEGEIEWRALQWLSVTTEGTVEKSRDETANASLDQVPQLFFSCGLDASRQMKKVKIDGLVRLNYIGKRNYWDSPNAHLLFYPDGHTGLIIPILSLKPYQTVDASLALAIKQYRITFTAQNLLNAKYEESASNLSPSRFVSVKLGCVF